MTGATGFIGNYVIQELLATNCEVIATSSNQDKAKTAPWFPKVRYIPFDLQAFNASSNYYSFFEEPDALIHLAWEGLSSYKESFHEKENVSRQVALLTNLITNGLADVTVSGTCLEYGMKEGRLSEDMKAEPVNSYAVAKNELRKQLESFRSLRPFSLKWVRLFYMYGHGQGPESLISQLECALNNKDMSFEMSGGEQVRDFLPVEKVAEYMVSIALQKKVTGIINCCSGNPVMLRTFVENYLRERNKTISLNLGHYPYSQYEPMKFWGDTKKLKSILHI